MGVEVCHDIVERGVAALDTFLFQLINGQAGHPGWDGLFQFLTAIGWGGLVWIALGLVFLLGAGRLPGLRDPGVRHWRALGVALLIALALSWGVESTLKPAIGRPRPPKAVAGARVLGTLPESYSFPSGHALSSFAAAGVLLAAARRHNRADAYAAVGLAALIGFSRIWVGHHYPLDVAAGAAGGLLLGHGVWAGMVRIAAIRGPRALD